MEFNSSTDNYNYVGETIIPDGKLLRSIKTEKELIIEQDGDAGKYAEEISGGIRAPQPVLSRSLYSLSDVNESPKNKGILGLLLEILDGQKSLNSKLEKIEKEQKSLTEGMEIILNNQAVLSKGQIILTDNQQNIATKLHVIELTGATKAEMRAQSKLLMECKVAAKKVQDSLCHMAGEMSDDTLDEVASMLPLRTTEAVKEVEEKLDSSDFAQAMNSYFYKSKGVSEDVGSVIRATFTDDLLEKYNWDGRSEKLSLASLMLVNKVIRDVFQKQGALQFEKGIKKAVERAHHRVKQKKYLKSKV